MQRKEQLLGSIYGAMIGEALGLQVDNPNSTNRLENSLWLKRHLYVATNILKVFSNTSLSIEELPSQSYISYIYWMSSRIGIDYEKEQEYGLHEKWSIEDFKYLNKYLKSMCINSLKSDYDRAFVPVFLEFKSLSDQTTFGQDMIYLNGNKNHHELQKIHHELLYFMGRSTCIKEILEIESQINPLFKDVFLRSMDDQNPFHITDTLSYLEYYKIIKILTESEHFEDALMKVIRTSSNPVEYGMLAGNLYGKYFGLSVIPKEFIQRLI